MDLNEFTAIKDKIKKAELSSASSKGKMQAIEDNWKNKYGFSTLEEAKNKLSEVEQEIKDKQEKQNNLFTKLQNSFDWNSI